MDRLGYRRAALGVAVTGSALLAGLLGVIAAPVAAAAEHSFSYDCASDTFTLHAQDLAASSENYVGISFGFGKGGTVEMFGSSGLGSPKALDWYDNTDDVGLGAFPVAKGDTLSVYYLENPDLYTSAELKSEGEVIGSFTYCGLSTAAKEAVLKNGNQHSWSYKGWKGTVSYDCKANAIYTVRTGSTAAPTDLQEVFVHSGGAGALSGFTTFRTSSPQLTTLMPKLKKGDRIEVYAVPYAWLAPPAGRWPTYPDRALAAKAKASKDAALIYAFDYGACKVPPPDVDLCPTKPGKQTSPCPPTYMVTVKWPKSSKKGASYTVQICQDGKPATCSKQRSTGTKRQATFKDLEAGKYLVKIRSVSGAGTSKPLKVKFTVTSKSRPST